MNIKVRIAENVATVHTHKHTDSLENNKINKIEKKIGILCLYQNKI